ncbi:hypothetical protein ASD39_20170 [Sphingomonas sp. Root50]|nr:hypothetical protein ASD17_14805 [Sphingomonas sp. Root1294]KQY72246.1 hypothetical protein ASD39_20170 [Sphingomonas sp. Root50]
MFACIVALFHLGTTSYIGSLSIIKNGWLFVDFFFVLSGFVIAAGYGSRLREGYPPSHFLLLRLGRIYPLHIVVLAAFVALECLALIVPSLVGARHAFTGVRTPGTIISNIFLMQPFADGLSWNQPSWSIATEFWTYVAFALICCFAARWYALIFVAIIIIAPISLALEPRHLFQIVGWQAQVRCLYGFAAGCLGYLIFQHVRVPRGALATLLETAMVIGIVAFVSLAGDGAWSLAAQPIFLGAVLIFAHQGGAVSALLLKPAFRTIGLLSYSIYMIHIFVEARFLDVLIFIQRPLGMELVSVERTATSATKMLVGPGVVGEISVLLTLAAIIACAAISYRYIEKPCRDWSRRFVAHLQRGRTNNRVSAAVRVERRRKP